MAHETEDIKLLKSLITAHPDFPKPGIVFQDIFPVMRDPVASEMMISKLVHFVQENFGKVDVIVGLDSRGFLFGPIMALRLGASFVPIRKQGKLPGQTMNVSYEKEYGVDVFEIQQGAFTPGSRVVIVDDLLATGGTMKAAVDLTRQAGGTVLQTICVIELPGLKGREKVDAPFHALLEYD